MLPSTTKKPLSFFYSHPVQIGARVIVPAIDGKIKFQKRNYYAPVASANELRVLVWGFENVKTKLSEIIKLPADRLSMRIVAANR